MIIIKKVLLKKRKEKEGQTFINAVGRREEEKKNVRDNSLFEENFSSVN